MEKIGIHFAKLKKSIQGEYLVARFYWTLYLLIFNSSVGVSGVTVYRCGIVNQFSFCVLQLRSVWQCRHTLKVVKGSLHCLVRITYSLLSPCIQGRVLCHSCTWIHAVPLFYQQVCSLWWNVLHPIIITPDAFTCACCVKRCFQKGMPLPIF